MTKPGATNPPSTFDARADSAAQALRGSVNRTLAQIPGRPQISGSAPVEVDANGKPPAPPPPAGSYAAQALERETQKQRQRFMQPNQRAEDSLNEEPPTEETPPPANAPESSRAAQRIQDLVNQLRDKDQDLQNAIAQGKTATETANQFQQRLTSLEQQHQQMLQRNLDSLDPETRAQVLMDARLQQYAGELEQRILGRIAPELGALKATAAQAEWQALAQKYQGYNHQIHAPLIDRFRARNPHCSIEQAFRAVAEPEELGVRPAARATAIPPTVPPGNGDPGAARFTPPVQRSKTTPDDELREDARRIAELRRSSDPAKQKQGLRELDEHLKRRLGG